VAGNAAYVIEVVLRTIKIGMLFAILVTAQAALTHLLRGLALEYKDLALVSAAFHVLFARSVAGFTALPLRSLFCEGSFPVRGSFKFVVNVFVAGFAGFGSHVES
jgi:hypothetical protein